MTIYPTNENDVSSYIKDVQYTFFNNTLPTGSGVLGSYPLDAFTSAVDLNAGQETISAGSVGSWPVNLLALSSTSNPQLEIQIQQNYIGASGVINLLEQGPAEQLVALYGSEYNVQIESTQIPGQNLLNLGSLPLTVAQLEQWYNAHPYSAAEWGSSSFWSDTSSSPSNQQVYLFWQAVNILQGTANPFSLTVVGSSPPPASFQDFVSSLASLQFPQQTVLGIPTDYVSGITETNTINPTFAANPNANATDPTAAQNSLLSSYFANYVQNYQSIISGLLAKAGSPYSSYSILTPQAFAAGWYEYLQQGFTSTSIPTQVQVYYNDGSGVSTPSGTYVFVPGATNPIPILTSGASIPSLSTFVNNFVEDMDQDYANQINFTQNYTGSNGSLITPSGTTSNSLFLANFQTFMSYMINQGGSSTVNSYDDWIEQWNSFVGPTALLNASGTENNSQNLMTYLEIYNVFYPSGNPQHNNFMNHLSSFVNGYLGTTGSGAFNPSQMIDQWFRNLVNQVYSSHVNVGPVSLDAASYESVRILNVLYKGLASMVESVQQLTISQATRLNFYSNEQMAYTDLLAKVPTFIENPIYSSTAEEKSLGEQSSSLSDVISVSPIDSNSLSSTQERSDANALASQYIEDVKSYRSEASAEGNQFQASFSQSNQAVNSEISVATEILQVVNTIANAIFAQQQSAFDGNST